MYGWLHCQWPQGLSIPRTGYLAAPWTPRAAPPKVAAGAWLAADRVAHRLAADHPQAVQRLMLLDIAPTLAMYAQTSDDFARAYWHWFFLIQPPPLPEALIESDPARYVRSVMGSRHAGLAPFDPVAELAAFFRVPAMVCVNKYDLNPDMGRAIEAYVKEKKLNKALIIGHSMGGTLGLWLAATEQTLFKKVIAVDALPCTGALMMPNYNSATMVYDNPYSKQMLQTDTATFRTQARQQVAFMMLNKQKQSRVVDWMLQADRETYVYGYIDLLKLDLREEVANINVPVVVLAATHPNKAMIEKTYNEQYAKLGNKVIHYADQSAHFVMYDQPDWYLTKIKENIK